MCYSEVSWAIGVNRAAPIAATADEMALAVASSIVSHPRAAAATRIALTALARTALSASRRVRTKFRKYSAIRPHLYL